ncbi:MAG: GldG family protein, partial [Chloroflexota bacterium]
MGSYGMALVVAGVVGLVAGIAVVAFVGSMRPYGYATIGIGAVLIGLVALVSFSSVFAAFIGRTGKYGVSSLVMLGAFTGIIIVLNFISFENSRRIDVTATNQFSLATRTKDVLKELEQPVRATAFYVTDVRQQQELLVRRAKVEETFREFKARSTKFSYRFIDPDLKPEIAREYGITQYESVVVEGLGSGLTSVVRPTDAAYSQLEQNLVTGILVVTGREQKAVYFLAGHGERSVSSGASDGYGTVGQGLERDNYKVLSLVWNPGEESVTVPEDTALLVVAGPKGELPETHARTLDLYLQGKNPNGSQRRGGGRMIFLAEPDTPASFREFLVRWGVVVAPGYIRDLDRSVPGNPNTL